MKPILSLITGTRNRPEGIARLIDSVSKHTSVPFEMLVGDASDLPYCGSYPYSVRIIRESPRLGHTRGYDRLFGMAQGEWLLWLNDDAEVTEGYAENAIRFMESHPNIGLGALVYSENGGPFHVNSAWGTVYANFGIFRKDLGEQVHYFDQELEMYGADNSLAFRILLAGKGVASIPDAKILHHPVEDAMRYENQKNRTHDNGVLTNKYMPYRRYWLATYEKHRMPYDESAWAHGVQPAGKPRIRIPVS